MSGKTASSSVKTIVGAPRKKHHAAHVGRTPDREHRRADGEHPDDAEERTADLRAPEERPREHLEQLGAEQHRGRVRGHLVERSSIRLPTTTQSRDARISRAATLRWARFAAWARAGRWLIGGLAVLLVGLLVAIGLVVTRQDVVDDDLTAAQQEVAAQRAPRRWPSSPSTTATWTR